MSENPTASEWAAGRGEKWSTHLSGMEGMLAPIDAPLILALRLDTPCRIADIGCGGGGTALDILHCAPAGSVVHGFDISPAQIETARARVRHDERAISFVVADAATAAPDTPFDRLVSRFGIMFFSNPPEAFSNLTRWLVPGGRFAFAVWGPPADNPWMTTVRDVVAEVVELPQADPDAPGPFRYADPVKLLALLDRAGFAELEVRDWCGTIPIGGGLPPAEAAQFALASFSSFADLLTEAGAQTLGAAQRSLTARFAQHQQDGVVRMETCVHLVTGIHPFSK